MLLGGLKFKLEVGDFLQVVFVLLADVLAMDSEFLFESTILVSEIRVGILKLFNVESFIIFTCLVLSELLVFILQFFQFYTFLVKLLLVFLS